MAEEQQLSDEAAIEQVDDVLMSDTDLLPDMKKKLRRWLMRLGARLSAASSSKARPGESVDDSATGRRAPPAFAHGDAFHGIDDICRQARAAVQRAAVTWAVVTRAVVTWAAVTWAVVTCAVVTWAAVTWAAVTWAVVTWCCDVGCDVHTCRQANSEIPSTIMKHIRPSASEMRSVFTEVAGMLHHEITTDSVTIGSVSDNRTHGRKCNSCGVIFRIRFGKVNRAVDAIQFAGWGDKQTAVDYMCKGVLRSMCSMCTPVPTRATVCVQVLPSRMARRRPRRRTRKMAQEETMCRCAAIGKC
jgi:hypothetical protein